MRGSERTSLSHGSELRAFAWAECASPRLLIKPAGEVVTDATRVSRTQHERQRVQCGASKTVRASLSAHGPPHIPYIICTLDQARFALKPPFTSPITARNNGPSDECTWAWRFPELHPEPEPELGARPRSVVDSHLPRPRQRPLPHRPMARHVVEVIDLGEIVMHGLHVTPQHRTWGVEYSRVKSQNLSAALIIVLITE